ncbi:MAG: dephospho-CoA kinase [Bacillota bacterium]|nr:dephospho-CoA kinase [Bacillota bacterium]
MKVIGLTGKSGSGKSTVASVFKKNGAAVIDADLVYHELCASSDEMKRELCRRFGDVLGDNSEVDRKKLASIVFNDKEALSDLNGIAHRYVLREINKSLASLSGSGVSCAVIDAPLLFESAADKLCDVTVGIIALKPDMVNRIALRDGISGEDIRMRLNVQPDDEFYIRNCNHIVENHGSLTELSATATGLFQKIMNTGV